MGLIVPQHEEFIAGYIECALWASLDMDDENECGHNPHLDENYGVHDISAELMATIREDCESFIRSQNAALQTYVGEFSWDYAGHDFFLTRNGHGAGFWDREWKPGRLLDACNELTGAAHVYGETFWFDNGRGELTS